MFSGPYGPHEVIQRSFGGHLVTRNSNLMRAIDSAYQKTQKKTYSMPQSEIWQKSFVLRSLSLEVIQRSFGGHLVTRNSNLMSAIDSASTKTYEKTYNMPQSEIWLERYVTGHYWSLEVIQRSFGGHLVTRNSNLISAIDSASTKTYEKTYYMSQSEIW